MLLFSHWVVSDSLRPHGWKHPTFCCPSSSPRGFSNSCLWVGDARHPSRPLSHPSPPTFNGSQHQGLFWWVGFSHPVAKILEFQLQRQYSQWILSLISFRIDWFDLLAVQGTLKSLIQHHSSKPLILQCPVFLMVQLSHPNMTYGKTIALYKGTSVGKVMYLLFNMLSSLVIGFIPSFSSFNFMAAVTICRNFGAQANKACQCFPIYYLWSDYDHRSQMPWPQFL